MKARGCARSITAGLVLALATPAGAQSIGYQLNRFEPSPAGDPFAVVEYPWYSSTRWFALRLTLDYSHNLLAAQHMEPTGEIVSDPAPIEHQSYGRLDAAAAVTDRIGFTLSLPVLLDETGTAFNGVGPSGTALGDPRAGLRARLFGQPDSSLSLSASAYIWIPVGAEDKHAGDEGVRLMPRLSVGGLALDHLRWSANASFLYRDTARLADGISPIGNTVGSEVQVASGLAYVSSDRRLSIGPEAALFVAVSGDIPDDQDPGTLELFASGRYWVTDAVELGLGGGAAIAGTPGPPDFRLMFSVGYAPGRAATSSFEQVIVLPDEDGHVGGIEVDDGKTKTVLNKAYASTQLSKKDTKVRAVQSSPQAVKAKLVTLEKALPPGDRDRDQILDGQDACPDRAGVVSTDPIRHGCPQATEKVVVLPDADGHVGGIEVNDGKTVTVLDKPYASSEVGSDGSARPVPPASPKAVARSVAVLSKALPEHPREDIADTDADKILDRDDACSERAGVADPDPSRNGCPRAVEKVVVLPDADGHVGAIEVDDGETKTVIDQAYATAEIGNDGRAHTVQSEPTQVAAQFVKAIAAQPAGARIIIYFNSRAEPARDLSGPIAAIVTEVQNKTGYTIEVVGHTDQVGSRTANRRIGRARAELIADRLVAAGIPRARVRVISKGASDPAIPVKDRKTVELRNRRVEVFVQHTAPRSR